MSIPLSYCNSRDYLRDLLIFLKNYQWIYNFQNTHILVKNIFSCFPSCWVEYFNNLPTDELKKLPTNGLENCPLSLKEFLNHIDRFKSNLQCEDFCIESYKFSHNCGLSEKKRHEIVSLAPIINKICTSLETNLIIDVGSGLGYLSHYLNLKYGHKVLGIECSKQYVESAQKNQEKHYAESKNDVIFYEHFIDNESSGIISQVVESNFSSMGLISGSLVGLHACADLSINILDIFSDLDFIKSLVIMPCCYHRIKLKKTSDVSEYFHNFPASEVLKKLCKDFEAQTFLRRPFLRLACQQSTRNFVNMSSEDHDRHSRNLLFRCILEEAAESENCTVERLKRKSNTISRAVHDDEDFEFYLKNLHNTHRLVSKNCPTQQRDINDNVFLMKMRSKWKQYKEKCYLMEVLTGLQVAIQSICENIILLDRVEYLKEKGFHCVVQKVTDDVLSPRCYALVARKI